MTLRRIQLIFRSLRNYFFRMGVPYRAMTAEGSRSRIINQLEVL